MRTTALLGACIGIAALGCDGLATPTADEALEGSWTGFLPCGEDAAWSLDWNLVRSSTAEHENNGHSSPVSPA